jgi:hypothetical protein
MHLWSVVISLVHIVVCVTVYTLHHVIIVGIVDVLPPSPTAQATPPPSPTAQAIPPPSPTAQATPPPSSEPEPDVNDISDQPEEILYAHLKS